MTPFTFKKTTNQKTNIRVLLCHCSVECEANVGRYERGDASPSADILNRIANALEVNPDFLMNGTLENKATDSLKDERLLIQYRKIEQLPEDKKNLLIEFLDGFIFKSSIHQQLAV